MNNNKIFIFVNIYFWHSRFLQANPYERMKSHLTLESTVASSTPWSRHFAWGNQRLLKPVPKSVVIYLIITLKQPDIMILNEYDSAVSRCHWSRKDRKLIFLFLNNRRLIIENPWKSTSYCILHTRIQISFRVGMDQILRLGICHVCICQTGLVALSGA